MRRSVATVSMSGTLRQKVEAVAAARFDGIELFENDFINFNGSAVELRTTASDLGLARCQAYGEPFADRFFFEIVQRRAYDAYGAVNAPARMAAQEQNTATSP